MPGADRRLANQADDERKHHRSGHRDRRGLIGRLRAQNPTVSDTEITNILIAAAYCPVVAQKADASPAEKWELMRQFDRGPMQQLAVTAMPHKKKKKKKKKKKVYHNLSNQA